MGLRTGGDPRRPGNGQSAFVNDLKYVDGPRFIRNGLQVVEGWSKLGIDRTVTDRGRTPGGDPSTLVNGVNDIDQAVETA
jgi:hypothetical protein